MYWECIPNIFRAHYECIPRGRVGVWDAYGVHGNEDLFYIILRGWLLARPIRQAEFGNQTENNQISMILGGKFTKF